jgi:hypothetical protein
VTRRPWLYAIEVAFLFEALFFTFPRAPSNEMDRLPLFPAGAFAVILFIASRLMRWWRLWFIAVIEAVAFAAFVWGSNEICEPDLSHQLIVACLQ